MGYVNKLKALVGLLYHWSEDFTFSYLLIGGLLRFDINMISKYFINTRNIFQWGYRYYSSLFTTSKKTINPRWSAVVILNYGKSFYETDGESSCTSLIWLNHLNVILYYNALGNLARIILYRDQCVPGLYLLFSASILDLGSRWHPNIIVASEIDPSP